MKFFGLATAIIFASVNAQATVLVNAPLPAHQNLITDANYGIAFAGTDSSGSLSSGAEVNKALGFRVLNMTSSAEIIYFDVQSNATTFPAAAVDGSQVVVTLSTSAGGSAIPLTGASVMNGVNAAPAACNSNGTTNCQTQLSTPNFISAFYTPGSTLRLSFTVAQLCSVATTVGSGSLCNTNSVGNQPQTQTFVQAITVSFSKLNPNPYTNTGLTSGSESLTLNLSITDIPPLVTVPSGGSENAYFPGDQSIIINADNYAPTVNNGVTLQSLAIFGSRTTTPVVADGLVIPPAGSEVAGYINFTGDRLVVPSGDNTFGTFVNTTNGTDNGYNLAVYAMNTAGILSSAGVGTPFAIGANEGISSKDGLVRTQTINSVLSESKCFIATAAFHDGRAGPVMMLRKFRDQVLSKSSLGRKFISTYYHYSPALAAWAWDKPIIRTVALHALAPVEFMAWAILKLTHAAQLESTQPYIDRIKKKLDDEDAAQGKHQVGDSYIDSVKKTLDPAPTPSAESYIESVKKKMPESEDPKGYSKKAKEDLPAESDVESPISAVKNGRDKTHVPERPPIKSAVSFKFGVHPGLKVTNPNGKVTFDDMYGNGVVGSFQPDLVLHYERYFFRSDNLGSLGLGADLGLTYAEGYGRYSFGFGSQNTKTSRTKFQFLQFPLTVNAIYRFNLFRILRPYAGIGVGSLFYTELRNDSGKDLRGYSPVYQTMFGAALKLDGADPETSRDSYLGNEIQHTYLIVEYMLLKSFNQSSVNFERNGIYAGVLFEY